MANTFRFRLLTPERIILDEEVEKVFTVSDDGEVEFLANHAPSIISTKICETSYFDTSGNKAVIFTNDGVINFRNNQLVFCCDSAEFEEEIDEARAVASKERAEKRLKDTEKNDAIRAKAALNRAVERLRILKK